MKAKKFNYQPELIYRCTCCAAVWKHENKHEYCPNCEVRLEYASQSPEPNTVTEPFHKEAIELVKKHIPNDALAKEYILELLNQKK